MKLKNYMQLFIWDNFTKTSTQKQPDELEEHADIMSIGEHGTLCWSYKCLEGLLKKLNVMLDVIWTVPINQAVGMKIKKQCRWKSQKSYTALNN